MPETLSIVVINEPVLKKLRSLPLGIREALVQNFNGYFLPQLQTYIKQQYLSAPPGYSATMLHHRTGNLKRSLKYSTASDATSVTGKVTVGPEAWYGKLHEEGGEMVRTSPTGKTSVHAVPARPFMSTSLKENRQEFSDMVRRVVAVALRSNP